MNSSDEDNPLRNTADRQADGTSSKLPDALDQDCSAPDRRPDSRRPVRIGREDAQQNIPPDPDPDDPAAP